MKRIYSEYYITKKPFYRIMNELCDYDFNITTSRKNLFSGFSSSKICNNSYDLKLLIENWSEMLTRFKKSNAYKTCDYIRNCVDKLKQNPIEYESLRDLNMGIGIIFEFSRVFESGAFTWNIKNVDYFEKILKEE